MRQYVMDHKAAYKRLVGLMFVEVIHKTPSGKLLRRIHRDEAKQMLKDGRLPIEPRSKPDAKL